MSNRESHCLACLDQSILLVDCEIPSALDVVEPDDDKGYRSQSNSPVKQRRSTAVGEPQNQEPHADNEVHHAWDAPFTVIWEQIWANEVCGIEVVGEFIEVLLGLNVIVEVGAVLFAHGP